ncbi:hypothetical protein NAT47_02410 [Flavobacterium sp. HXWNR69]|jgi:hypothetical protein|uniref:Uncharacterized protein n=1 Tax=Flavobacterium fragile TaxID=2949085 RepID=A0ABT0TED7_9FLAO|nr:hypothetical protein [Flavobacterium sp. HXWNR69]MCL9769257.1 hypothetical protein [Flavobacterium sp. HXWNR69]
MEKIFLFALDSNTQEVIVSDSSKGSNQINFIERIKQTDNELLYSAVQTLTLITKSPNFDISIFNSMEKICKSIYNKHKKLK